MDEGLGDVVDRCPGLLLEQVGDDARGYARAQHAPEEVPLVHVTGGRRADDSSEAVHGDRQAPLRGLFQQPLGGPLRLLVAVAQSGVGREERLRYLGARPIGGATDRVETKCRGVAAHGRHAQSCRVDSVLAARRVAYSRMMLTVAALWKIASQVAARSAKRASSRPSPGRARSAGTAVIRSAPRPERRCWWFSGPDGYGRRPRGARGPYRCRRPPRRCSARSRPAGARPRSRWRR